MSIAKRGSSCGQEVRVFA